MNITDNGRAKCAAVLSFRRGIGSLQKRPNCAKHLIYVTEDTVNNDIYLEEGTEFTVTNHAEGAPKQVYTTRYERNQSLRTEAIRLHGTTCMACGFNFQKVYGNRGKDYIEVHHVKPLASVGEAVDVDPTTDLVVVCANCHRIIHRKKDEILTLDELKAIIMNNQTDSADS